ncbi:SMR domain-containing protein [Canna indica]|uniref:SMR domain-containing protein n=1 Tax=Canna indica TaxID=4628 RepID=A0AAQ3QHF0_9LILI|nr:SMR domain-containing protein [Canna indica]
MKSSKNKRNRKKRKHSPAAGPDAPKTEETATGILAKGVRGEDEQQKQDLGWLAVVFSSLSIDEIDLTYREAGGDPFLAAGILGAQLDDPGDEPARGGGEVGSSKIDLDYREVGGDPLLAACILGAPLDDPGKEPSRGRGAPGLSKFFGGTQKQKQKRAVASTGIVSDVIGKAYSVRGKFNRDENNLQKGSMTKMYSVEDAEQFLCSMLGDASEIGMDVVKDVLGECMYDIEKALDILLDISVPSPDPLNEGWQTNRMPKADCSRTYPESPSNSDALNNSISSFQQTDRTVSDEFNYHLSEERKNGIQTYMGYGNRTYANILADCWIRPTSKSEPSKSNLQQEVLESLFDIPNFSASKPNCVDWKKVAGRVESFRQGMEFCSVSLSSGDTQSTVTSVETTKEDHYEMLRRAPKKHWDMMRSYYQQAAFAFSRGDRANALLLSDKGKFHHNLARMEDERASQDIFLGRNKHIKNMVTIDLHGQHIKQGIELLKLHLITFSYLPSVQYLKVITGYGSLGDSKGKMKDSVLALVQREGIKWREENAGTLVLCLDGGMQYSFVYSDSE